MAAVFLGFLYTNLHPILSTKRHTHIQQVPLQQHSYIRHTWSPYTSFPFHQINSPLPFHRKSCSPIITKTSSSIVIYKHIYGAKLQHPQYSWHYLNSSNTIAYKWYNISSSTNVSFYKQLWSHMESPCSYYRTFPSPIQNVHFLTNYHHIIPLIFK